MNTHPTNWPLLVCMNEEVQGTTYHGMSLEADMSRGSGASMGVTAVDFSGGQGFKTQFHDCVLSLGSKEGLHIGWECAAHPGGHIASEWLFERCTLNNVRIEGTQTVNFKFFVTHISGRVILDGCAVSFETLYAPWAKTMFSLGWQAMLYVNDFFIDQGGYCLVDFNSYQCGRVEINRAWTKGWSFLCRAPVATERHDMLLRNWPRFQPGAEGHIAYHCAFDKLKLDFADNLSLERTVSVVQPTKLEYESRVI